MDNFHIAEYNMDQYHKMWKSNSEEALKNKYLIALDLSLKELSEMAKGDEEMEKVKNDIQKLSEDVFQF